ncbi:hypothetical protein NMG60_11014789 [Bertholletia excelsa]
MGGGGNQFSWPPTGAPLDTQRDDHWSHFDSSVNAVSFGFVATAILICMFLVMAIFERFLTPNSPDSSPDSRRRYARDIESQMGFAGKLLIPSPKLSVTAREVSVLMPGEKVPTFIAHPVPLPCPPEPIIWPTHHHISMSNISQGFSLNTASSSSST